ncbi:MAG: hypothetical protein M1444_00145 [Patescibacteria group bacterium]|nr:hypothetical protein [Patescibacteria group bacterium]
MRTNPEVLSTSLETHSHFRIDKPIPQVGRLLRFATKGDPEAQRLVAEQSRKYDSPYLAWELVRKLRAGTADSVGQVFSDGIRLPNTGFEGYFSGLPPEEVVAEEADLGIKILRGMGYFANYETTRYTLWEMNRFLSGRIQTKDVVGIMQYFDEIFAVTLARARARSADDCESFRRETYAHLSKGHSISYQIDQDGIHQTITLPVVPCEQIAPPRVELKRIQLKGYLTLAEIGRFGHPLGRSALDFYRKNR